MYNEVFGELHYSSIVRYDTQKMKRDVVYNCDDFWEVLFIFLLQYIGIFTAVNYIYSATNIELLLTDKHTIFEITYKRSKYLSRLPFLYRDHYVVEVEPKVKVLSASLGSEFIITNFIKDKIVSLTPQNSFKASELIYVLKMGYKAPWHIVKPIVIVDSDTLDEHVYNDDDVVNMY